MDKRKFSLIQFVKLILSKKKVFIRSIILSVVLGLTVAFCSQKEYESSCLVMPEVQEGIGGSLGNLGGLAGLAGINLNMGMGGEISPELYGKIVHSTNFLWGLVHEDIYFSTLDHELSTYTYFKEIQKPSVVSVLLKYTIGLPSLLLSQPTLNQNDLDQEVNLVYLSEEDKRLLSGFSDRILLDVDEVTSLVTIKVEMPDPHASARLTNKVVDKLTKSIVKYRIEKASTNLKFVQERFDENKREYQLKEKKLAEFRDQNKNFGNAVAEIEYNRLRNEYEISFEVYKSLASQLEQAKIKVKEDTPIFTILQYPEIPTKKSKPKRLVILVLFGILSVIVPLGYYYVRGELEYVRSMFKD